MKKICLLALSCWTMNAAAQQIPPGRPQKPAPENLRVLTPPDLRVEELSLVSVVRNSAVKKMNIQVLMRFKNTGELRCGPSTALAYVKSPAGTGATRTLPVSFPVAAINPGESFVKVYTFQEAEGVFRSETFEFWIKADARNVITESNETNNTSVVLTIETPPARRE